MNESESTVMFGCEDTNPPEGSLEATVVGRSVRLLMRSHSQRMRNTIVGPTPEKLLAHWKATICVCGDC